MAQGTRGKHVPIGPGRTLVDDLMRQTRDVPSVIVRREFRIPAVVAAREDTPMRVSWVGLFAKAFGLAARQHACLRRSWISFPTPRIYEHPRSEALIPIERDWQGEDTVLPGKLREPEAMSLATITEHLRDYARRPVMSVSPFRQALRLAGMPFPLRRFLLWSSLNASGAKRAKRFGTFIVSSLGDTACELVGPRLPLTSYLSFGPIDGDGRVDVCLSFDHRVMDGRQAARALVEIERLLNTVLAAELRAMAPADTLAVP